MKTSRAVTGKYGWFMFAFVCLQEELHYECWEKLYSHKKRSKNKIHKERIAWVLDF